MDREMIREICEEYIHQLWCMVNLNDACIFGLYGLEQHRIELHDRLCNAMQIDHIKSKQILSCLDERLGIDFSEKLSDSDIRNYADKLIDLLLSEKNKGNI